MEHCNVFGSAFVVELFVVIFLLQVSVVKCRLPQSQKTEPQQQLMLSTSECGKTKGCFFEPDSCSSSKDCDYLMTYEPKGSSITFELSSKTKWVSVGFNKKAIMDGTDSIICSALPNGSIVIGHYPVIGHKTPVKTTQKIPELKFEGIANEGGVIKCRFTREKKSHIMAADLNKDVFVIFASGPTGQDNSLDEHSWKAHSMSPVNLAKIETLEASAFDLLVIQLHAVCMVFAWVGFASAGMFIARFMRPIWGEKEICGKRIWFLVHLGIMLCTATLTLVGVGFAFLYVGQWSGDAGAHPFIGVIVLAIAVLQPTIALFRPPLNAGRRRLFFNWAHRGGGLLALSLAVINIYLGCVLPAFHLDNSAVYVMLVYILGCGAVVVFEFYLACQQPTGADDYRVLSRPEGDEVEVVPVPRRQTDGEIRKKFRLHNIMFGVLLLVVIVVCLAMLVLLTAHEEADDDDD